MSEFSKYKFLNVKQNESKSRIKICCVKQGQCLEVPAAHPYPDFPLVVPPWRATARKHYIAPTWYVNGN